MRCFPIVGVVIGCLVVLSQPFPPDLRAASLRAAEVPPDPRAAGARFMDGLRRRHLFSLAESHCRRRLADPHLAPRGQADWTIELVRTLVGQAMAKRSPTKSPTWDQAHRACGAFAKQFPNHPFASLVAIEDAVTWVVEARLVWTMGGRTKASATAARGLLRDALRRLESLDADLSGAVRDAYQDRASDPRGLTAKQLQSVRNQTSYHWARALRLQGETYRIGEVDRSDAISQALDKLTPLAELPVADAFLWRCRLERVACLRLLGRFGTARQQFARVHGAELPVDLRLHVEAERVRLLLAADHIEQARAIAKEKTSIADAGSEDLELAKFETALAAWRWAVRKGSAEAAAELGNEVSRGIDRIGSRFGPIAMRRAESLLTSTVPPREADHDPVILEQLAKSFYHQGRAAEAVATYDQLAGALGRRQATDQAFRAAFTAATITRQQQRDQQAMERYRDLALRMPDHPRAAESHLLATFQAAELVRTASPATRPAAVKRYANLLDQQCARWPNSPTCNRARLWLGQLRESQRQWHEAMEAYQQVRPDDTQYARAARGVARCSPRVLAEQAAAGIPTGHLARAAADFLDPCVKGTGGQWPTTWTDFNQFCGLTEAALLVHYDPAGHPRARQILERLLDGPPRPGPAVTAAAYRLLIVTEARQGDFQAATGRLNRLDAAASAKGPPTAGNRPDPPATAERARVPPMLIGWHVLFDDLMRMADTAAGPRREHLAELAIRVAGHVELQTDPLPAEAARQFARRRAEAMLAAGHRHAAIDAVTALAATRPKDGPLHEDLARLLLSSDQPERLRAGLRLASEVERHSRPGGPRWFRARYLQATGFQKLHDDRTALRLIARTRILYPAMGGSTLRGAFEQLRAKCQVARPK